MGMIHIKYMLVLGQLFRNNMKNYSSYKEINLKELVDWLMGFLASRKFSHNEEAMNIEIKNITHRDWHGSTVS